MASRSSTCTRTARLIGARFAVSTRTDGATRNARRQNDRAITRAAARAALVVCAWGAHVEHIPGALYEVANAFLMLGPRATALKLTASGQPVHPLMHR